MKLKLNQSLRAALMACYALAAPIATTITTGAMVTGVTLTLLAPQAQADVFTWNGGTNASAYYGANWADSAGESIANGRFDTDCTDVMKISASTDDTQIYIDYGNSATNHSSFGGLYVEEGSTGNIVRPSASNARDTYFRASSDTDATAIGGVAGATNFIISDSFSYGTSGYRWRTLTSYANLNIDVASGKTFNMYTATLNTSTYNVSVQGGGTFILDASTGVTGTGNWTVSESSTLKLVDNAANLLTSTAGAGSVTLDGGTVALATGSTIAGTIGVGAGGGTIALTGVADGETGAITLNGTISYADSIGTLDLGDSALTVGENFAFDFSGIYTVGTVYDLLANFNGDLDGYNFKILDIDVSQTASFQIDAESGNLQVVFADSGSQSIVWGGGSGTWDDDNAWTAGDGTSTSFDNGDAVTFGATSEASTISLAEGVDVTSMSIEGSWSFESYTSGEERTLDAKTITINGASDSVISMSADVHVQNVDTLQVTSGQFTINGSLSDVGAIQVNGGSLGLNGATDKVGSISVADGATFTLGSGVAATNMGSLTMNGTATVNLLSSVHFTSASIAGASTLVVGAGADVIMGDTEAETVTEMYSTGYSYSVGEGGSLTLAKTKIRLQSNGAALNVSGGGTLAIDSLMLGDGSGCDTFLTVENGSTLHITGTAASTDHLTSSVVLGHWDTTNTINVEGIMIAEAALTQKDGSANVNIGSNGTLELKSGLDFYDVSTGYSKTIITVNGTLKLGANTQTSDSADMGVTMNNGGTIESTATTTVYDAVTYSADASVKFKAADSTTLTIAKAVTGTNISATIQGAGAVAFSDGASLNNLGLESGASLTLAGATTVAGSITNAGNLTIAGELILTTAIDNTNGTLHFAEGALLDISAIKDGWTEVDGVYSYTLINGGTITGVGDDVSTLFTNASLIGKQNVTFTNGIFSYSAITGVVYEGGETTLELAPNALVGGTEYTDGWAITFTTSDATVNVSGSVAPSDVIIEDGVVVTLSGSDGCTLSSSNISLGAGSTLIVDEAVLAKATELTTGSHFGVTAESSMLIYDLNGVTLTNDTRIEGFTGELTIRDGKFLANNYSMMEHGLGGAMDFTALTVEAGATFELAGASLNNADYDIAFSLVGGDTAANTATFAGNSSTVKGDFTLSGHTTLNAGGAFNINGDISNDAATDVLLKTGTGTLTVTGGANFSGALSIDAGKLALGAASSFGSIAATGESTIGVTTSLTVGGNTLTLTGTHDISLSDGSSITANSITNADLSGMTVSTTADTLTLAGTVAMGSLYITDDITINLEAGANVSSDVLAGASGGHITSDLTIVLGNKASYSTSDAFWYAGATNDENGTSITWSIESAENATGGSVSFGSVLIGYTSNASGSNEYLNIGAGTTLNLTSSEFSGGTSDALILGGSGTTNAYVEVNGNLVVTSAGLSTYSGHGTVNVYDGGSLTLNEGLRAEFNSASCNDIAVNIESGATLYLGDQANELDYSDTDSSGEYKALVVNVKDGATVSTYTGEDAEVNVYTSMVYGATTSDEDTTAEVNLVATDNKKLIMQGAVTAAQGIDVTANITGDVTLAGGATLSAIDVADGSSLTINGTNNTVTTTNVNGGSLKIASGASLTGDIVLNGGSLTVDGELVNALSVTGEGSSLGNIGGALTLSSTITLADDCSLDLTNAGQVSLDTSFALDLSAWDFTDTSAQYTVFTGLSNDLSSNANLNISGATYDSDNYEINWDFDSESGSLTANFTEVTSEPTDSDWNSETGNYEIGTDADSSTDLTIDTSNTDAGTTPEIQTGTTDEGTTTTGTVEITGVKDVTITGNNALASSTITIGTDDAATNVTVSTAVSASESMDIKGGSTVTVDDNGSIANTTITLGTAADEAASTAATKGTVNAGVITLSGQGATVDGSVTKDYVSSAVVSGAKIEVAQSVAASSSIFSAREATYTGGVLENTKIKDASSIELAQYANLKFDTVVLGADTTFTAAGTNELTFTNCNTINANTTDNNLAIASVDSPAVGASVATYTIDTFNSLTDTSFVIIEGELWISLSLTGAEFAAVQGYWSKGELFDIILEFGDAPITDSLTNATVMISNADGAGSYALTVDANAVQVSGNDLVITVPEPSTATLSLLALTALLARRRRRQA